MKTSYPTRLAPYLLVLAAALLALLHLPSGGPAAVATAAEPKLYVGLFGDNAVAVVDSGTKAVLSTIPGRPEPHGMAVPTPDGRRVYVSSDGASVVTVIDTATDQAVGSVEVGRAPHGLAITPDGRTVVATVFEGNQVALVDTTTNRVAAQVAVPNPHNVAISPDGRTAYVASQAQGAASLAVLDLPSQTQVGSVALDKTPRALAFSPDGKWVYFTQGGRRDPRARPDDQPDRRSGARRRLAALRRRSRRTASTRSPSIRAPARCRSCSAGGRTVSGTVAVGQLPHWIAIDGDGDTAYVTIIQNSARWRAVFEFSALKVGPKVYISLKAVAPNSPSS